MTVDRDVRRQDTEIRVEELKEAVRQFCLERDWDQFHGAKDLAIGISTEAAELLAHFRFLSASEVEELFDDAAQRIAIVDELADVLIFVLRFAQRYDIDLSQAVASKLAANARRYPVETARGSNRKAQPTSG